MAAPRVIKNKDLRASDVEFGNLGKKDGKHVVPITINKSPVVMQVRKLKFKEALVNGADEVQERTSLSGFSSTIVDFLKALEKRCCSAAFENSKQWFKKDIPESVIEGFLSSALGDDNVVACNVQFADGVHAIRCFNQATKEPMEVQSVDVEKECDCILHVVGIKFYKKSFCLLIHVMQIRAQEAVAPDENICIDNYAFMDSDEDDNNDEEEVASVASAGDGHSFL